MITVKKTTPSENILLSWLAGIVDGEGSIGIYHITGREDQKRPVFTVVNTDRKILDKIKNILNSFNLFYSFAPKSTPKHQKQCYYINVNRRDDFEYLLKLLRPFLVGEKRDRAIEAIKYLESNPRKLKPTYYCKYCKKAFTGRKKQYCSLKCWHLFSVGKDNPNFRHGKYIACND